MLLGHLVHARAGREIVGRLGAAVQHHDERQRLPAISARHVELVGAAPGLIGVGPLQELAPVRHDVGRARRRPIDEAIQVRQAAARVEFELLKKPAQRLRHGRLARRLPPSGHGLCGGPLEQPGACGGLGVHGIDRLGDEVDSVGRTCARWAFGAGVGVEGASDAVPPLSMRCKSAVASISRPAWISSVRLDEGGVREMIHG